MTWKLRALLQPEAILLLLSFPFHFTWEMLQDPLYLGLLEKEHGVVRSMCLQATFGDVVITFIAFGAASLFARSRYWFDGTNIRSYKPWIVWYGFGVAITIVIEIYSTTIAERWAYGPLMPIIPLISVGLSPVLQWIIVPVFTIHILKFYFRGLKSPV